MRITFAQVADDRTTLSVEGGIGAERAELLKRQCSRLLRAGVSLTLDLSGADLVDRLGVEILRRLGRGGVEFRCRRGTVASLLEGEGIRFTLVPGGGP